MEEHIIICMLKLRFTKYISLDNIDIRLYSFDLFVNVARA